MNALPRKIGLALGSGGLRGIAHIGVLSVLEKEGVPIDMVSWGTMLSEAQSELVQGKWWQLVAATTMMATFVTAFALLTDALRDALDPKLG